MGQPWGRPHRAGAARAVGQGLHVDVCIAQARHIRVPHRAAASHRVRGRGRESGRACDTAGAKAAMGRGRFSLVGRGRKNSGGSRVVPGLCEGTYHGVVHRCCASRGGCESNGGGCDRQQSGGCESSTIGVRARIVGAAQRRRVCVRIAQGGRAAQGIRLAVAARLWASGTLGTARWGLHCVIGGSNGGGWARSSGRVFGVGGSRGFWSEFGRRWERASRGNSTRHPPKAAGKVSAASDKYGVGIGRRRWWGPGEGTQRL
ncbi:hypothetical protein B0H13DRAFT_2404764 [Mycena leptocephala]|nr:hypothetical protein B0H13DRAFT_2404764 [Mycena leptocephala]